MYLRREKKYSQMFEDIEKMDSFIFDYIKNPLELP